MSIAYLEHNDNKKHSLLNEYDCFQSVSNHDFNKNYSRIIKNECQSVKKTNKK